MSHAPGVVELVPVSEEGLRTELDARGLLVGMVDRAILQSRLSHGLQVRDNGEPYLDQHIFPIALETAEYFQDDPLDVQIEAVTSLILHDAVEDDPDFTLARCAEDFSDSVALNVWRLSKISGELLPYIFKLFTGNEIVRAGKILDRNNNLESSILLFPERAEKTLKYLGESRREYLPLSRTLRNQRYASHLLRLIEHGEAMLQV